MMNQNNPRYIYESTDGGRTVYQRISGCSSRTKILDKNKESIDYKTFSEITDIANTDPAMKDILDQLYTYWKLKYS